MARIGSIKPSSCGRTLGVAPNRRDRQKVNSLASPRESSRYLKSRVDPKEECRLALRLKDTIDLGPGEFGIKMTPNEVVYLGQSTVSARVKYPDSSNGMCRLAVHRENGRSFSQISDERVFNFTQVKEDRFLGASQLMLFEGDRRKISLICNKHREHTWLPDHVTLNDLRRIVGNYADVDLECPVSR